MDASAWRVEESSRVGEAVLAVVVVVLSLGCSLVGVALFPAPMDGDAEGEAEGVTEGETEGDLGVVGGCGWRTSIWSKIFDLCPLQSSSRRSSRRSSYFVKATYQQSSAQIGATTGVKRRKAERNGEMKS